MEKVSNYILASHVCLIPHNNFEHTQTTVPHKLFQAMVCKKPVLVSDCKPLKRIIIETQAGKIFKANNNEDFAEKLISMYFDTKALAKFGDNGYKAACGEYAWRHDAARLNQIYSELLLYLLN
jgi:glycosyltransferase involved in cell wall biosynthesis